MISPPWMFAPLTIFLLGGNTTLSSRKWTVKQKTTLSNYDVSAPFAHLGNTLLPINPDSLLPTLHAMPTVDYR